MVALPSWARWLLAALVVLGGSFAVGYLLSTVVLFPPPETAGTGIPTPSLYGETREGAERALRSAGLELGEVSELASIDTERGRILAQHPIPGQELRRGSTVSIALSGGSPDLVVPPVAGMSVATARELLEAIGFEVAEQQADEARAPQGTVVSVQPAPGTRRTLPNVVTLLVSRGAPRESGAEPRDTAAAPPGPLPGVGARDGAGR